MLSPKSIVTPSSNNRLSAGRKTLRPLQSRLASPGSGVGSTVNSDASPEQPPAVTLSRNPDCEFKPNYPGIDRAYQVKLRLSFRGWYRSSESSWMNRLGDMSIAGPPRVFTFG